MGSISRANRCERFIHEFKGDILETYKLRPEQKFRLHSVNLGMDGGTEVVKLFVEFQRLTQKGKETKHFVEMELTGYLFDPEGDVKDQLEQIQHDAGLATQAEVERRMKRADLGE